MKTIPLSQRKVTIVDDGDFEELSKYKWHAHKDHSGRFYAVRNVRRSDGGWTTQPMHRVILGETDPKIQIDHISGDGLDNRRSNLRVATHSQNMRNRGKTKLNTSGYKGVTCNRNKWQTKIHHQGKTIHGGRFDTPIAAAAFYNWMALRFHGPYARLNEV